MNIFKRHLHWSHEADSYQSFAYSIYRLGGTYKCVFCSNRIRTLVAMADYSFHWLIMGKMEIRNFLLSHHRYLCCFFLQKCFMSSPLQFIWILSKSLNLIGHHATKMVNFRKNIQKSSLQKSVRGMKLKICNHVHDISLYINYVFYCHCPCAFVAMAT